jgi:hypothetical protein
VKLPPPPGPGLAPAGTAEGRTRLVREAFLLFIVASVVWVAAWYVAFASESPFLTPVARSLPFVGPLFFAVGIRAIRAAERTKPVLTKRSVVGTIVLAAAIPVTLRVAPGLRLEEPTPIPGEPWLVVGASPDGIADIYLIKGVADVRDGSGFVRLTNSPEAEGGADLSPDRRQLALSSQSAGTFDLWILDLDADGNPVGEPRRITSDEPSHELFPRWSPDGDWIAFQLDLGDQDDVALVRSDGSRQRQLTHDGDSQDAQWSPDGSLISFSRPTESDPEDLAVWTMGTDGSDPEILADTAGDDYGSVFISPDLVAFTSDPGDEEDVWIVELPDRELWNLTDDPLADDFSLATVSNGHVLFTSDRAHAGGSFLYYMEPYGEDPTLAAIL